MLIDQLRLFVFRTIYICLFDFKERKWLILAWHWSFLDRRWEKNKRYQRRIVQSMRLESRVKRCNSITITFLHHCQSHKKINIKKAQMFFLKKRNLSRDNLWLDAWVSYTKISIDHNKIKYFSHTTFKIKQNINDVNHNLYYWD